MIKTKQRGLTMTKEIGAFATQILDVLLGLTKKSRYASVNKTTSYVG